MDFITQTIQVPPQQADLQKQAEHKAHCFFHRLKQKHEKKLAIANIPIARMQNIVDVSFVTNSNGEAVKRYFNVLNYNLHDIKLERENQKKLWSMFFLSSVHYNCICCIQYLLDNVPNLNIISREELLKQQDSNGLQALHIAAKNGNQASVNLILHYLPTALAQMDAKGKIPLHYAVSYGADTTLLDRLLLKTFLYIPDESGETVLHLAIVSHFLNKKIKEEFLQYIVTTMIAPSGFGKALLNKQNLKQNTPLHTAVRCHYVEGVKLLLDYGANPNTLDDEKYSPLHTAIAQKQIEIVKLLLGKGATLNILDRKQYAPLHAAIFYRSFEIVKLLLDYGANPNTLDEEKNTSLHTAIFQKNSFNTIKLLLNQGADFNITDAKNRTPLHTAILHNQLDSATLLINKGANVNVADNENITALHTAVSLKHNEIVQLLLEKGADPNALDAKQFTPLHLAIHCNNFQIAQLLLDHPKTKLDIQNQEKLTPLHAVTIYVALHKQDPSLHIHHQKTLETLYATTLHAEKPYREKLQFFNQLLTRTQAECPEVMYTAETDGYTPLHLAVRSGYHVTLIEKFSDKDKNLLYTINKKDGKNLLHTAIEFGLTDIVLFLKNQTADGLQNAKDHNSKTPLDLLNDQDNPILFHIKDKQASKERKKIEQLFFPTLYDIIPGLNIAFPCNRTQDDKYNKKRKFPSEESSVETFQPMKRMHL